MDVIKTEPGTNNMCVLTNEELVNDENNQYSETATCSMLKKEEENYQTRIKVEPDTDSSVLALREEHFIDIKKEESFNLEVQAETLQEESWIVPDYIPNATQDHKVNLESAKQYQTDHEESTSVHISIQPDLNFDNQQICETVQNTCSENKPKRIRKTPKVSNVEHYTCATCNKVFLRRTGLTRHIRIHTAEAYKCTSCNKVFSRAAHLQTHLRIHTGEKPYVCDICNKSFSQRGTLIIHYRTHTGEKRYQCDICSKNFSRRDTLQGHKRIHTREKQYKCEVCNKRFLRKWHLTTHQLTHSGVKTHGCKVCKGKFSVKKHARIHTGERTLKCGDCDVFRKSEKSTKRGSSVKRCS